MADCMVSHNWFGLDTILHGGRSKDRRKVGNNTYLVRRGEDIAVRLHYTDILTFYRDGRIKINSGGWQTVTTRDRWNQYLPGAWNIQGDRGTYYLYNGEKRWGYRDGMIIHPDGTVTDYAPESDEERNRRLRRLINKHARLVADSLPLERNDLWGLWHRSEDAETLERNMVEDRVTDTLVYCALHIPQVGPMVLSAAFGQAAYPVEVIREFVRRKVRSYLIDRLITGRPPVVYCPTCLHTTPPRWTPMDGPNPIEGHDDRVVYTCPKFATHWEVVPKS